jgi:hypothetical protein
MSTKIEYQIFCDGCDIKTDKIEIEYNSSEYDILRDCIMLPEDWIWLERFQKLPKFFHNENCANEWLKKQGITKEIEKLNNGLWFE